MCFLVSPDWERGQQGRGQRAGHTAFFGKEVRKSCDNALVTAVYILGMPYAWRRFAIFIECTHMVERWHSAQAKAVRSVQESSSWVCEQVSSKFMLDANRLWAPVCLPSCVQKQGFWLPTVDAPQLDDRSASMEDQLAGEAISLTTNILKQRLSRTLDMTLGWPACDTEHHHHPDHDLRRLCLLFEHSGLFPPPPCAPLAP